MAAGFALRAALACAVMVGAGAAGAAGTHGDPAPQLCRDAAGRAAARHGIPEAVMQAITLVETRRVSGGTAGPWPWTLNIEGAGHWFPSRADARARAEREIASGRVSVDIGCFQLNYRWHGSRFASPDAMLEPDLAADYAARFLAELHAETGDWMRAAGHYHSRTPEHAARYRELVARAIARIGGNAMASKHPRSAAGAAAAAVRDGAALARGGTADAVRPPQAAGTRVPIIVIAAREPDVAATAGAVQLRLQAARALVPGLLRN